jgi:hypothetical protein
MASTLPSGRSHAGSLADQMDALDRGLIEMHRELAERLQGIEDILMCRQGREPEEPSWPPPGYPPSRRHGMRLVAGGRS